MAALAPIRPKTMGERLAEDLLWTQEEREANFARMDALFPSTRVRHSGEIRSLPLARPLAWPVGVRKGRSSLDEYVADQKVAGVLILQDGKIRAERYALGLHQGKRWTSFSVTKSITSTLVGAAIRDGAIRSVSDSLVRYIPELRGSAYDGVTVRHLLTMTSGVRWVEDYLAPDSDNARLYATPHRPGTDTVVEYMRHLPREALPGTRWVYKTGESDLTGVLVRRATKRSLSVYLSEKIWQPYGMEADATWVAEDGREYGGSGLSATLRDYGRFGHFVLHSGDGVLDREWFASAIAPLEETGTPGRGYGYQWWTFDDGAFAALGIFGQSIFVDRVRRLVIVTLSAWPEATSVERSSARMAFWQQTRALLDGEMKT